MAITHFRHQLYLHRSKIVAFLVLALMGLGQQAKAQGRLKGENLPGYEHRKLRWGFSLGVNYSWYHLEHSQFYIDQIAPTIDSDNDPSTPPTAGYNYSVNAKPGIGFNVNFISTYRLASNFVLRAQPGVGYHSRVVEYKGNFQKAPDEGIVLQELNTFSAELPLLVKYESNRRKNTQLYFVAGVKPSIVVGGPKKNDPEVLQLQSYDLTLEYGVGLDMFYPYFKFAPEIRYSRGLANLHRPYPKPGDTSDNSPAPIYNNSLQKLTTNTITLYLNFE